MDYLRVNFVLICHTLHAVVAVKLEYMYLRYWY